LCHSFRVEVRVAQPHEPSIFTLWDCECYALINKTATDINKRIIDEVKHIMAFFYQLGVKKFGIFHSGVYFKKLPKTG